MPPSGTTFEQYLRDVYAWAYRLLGHHQDSLDVVQDVFVKWTQQCAKQPPDQPRGWLRRATLNRAIDMRRHVQADREHTMQIADRIRSQETANSDADQSLLRRDMAVALDTLTDIQRSVVVAKVYDNLTFAEIADEHGLAVSTVKTHYVRALSALHNRLHPRWAEKENQS